ncbi:uncharacterized protein LOC129590854 [Paramacrobiotus metropolitanus]|uniref:uncharacterized protein LOC129590854 n=1 Tax=Paramacrobiotus metropolitanus TaxID=2943436 RepID=UPI0024460D9F|nr:uncharacterized protein LOC129590854 [Paramacrobiotus metropolitanus]
MKFVRNPSSSEMPVALVTKDDSAVQNVPYALHFNRSRSCGDCSTFDPAFDDVMRRALEKSSYAKRLNPLIRQQALLSLVRNLVLFTAFVVEYMRLPARSVGELEHEEAEDQEEEPDGRPFLLQAFPYLLGGCCALSIADFVNAVLLWCSMQNCVDIGSCRK